MTVAETTQLIEPHGGKLVDRTGPRPDGIERLEQIPLTSRELSDLDMIASGALSPLEGFMNQHDYERVVEDMRLARGLPWALPVCLAVDRAPDGEQVVLTDEAGTPVAMLEVDEAYEYDKEREAEHCFRTIDDDHPGVARLYQQKPGRRLPDAQPDPPGARVPDQGRARDRGRIADPPTGGRHEVG